MARFEREREEAVVRESLLAQTVASKKKQLLTDLAQVCKICQKMICMSNREATMLFRDSCLIKSLSFHCKMIKFLHSCILLSSQEEAKREDVVRKMQQMKDKEKDALISSLQNGNFVFLLLQYILILTSNFTM